MNIILFSENEITDSKFKIDDRRFDHIKNVLKLSENDNFKCGMIDGKIGEATITSIDENCVSGVIELNKNPQDKIPLTLIVSYPRAKTLKKVLQYSASLGVKAIIIVNSYRVDKSYWKNPILKDENIRKELLLGLEQSGDTILPKVSIERRFKPFVEDSLPSLIKDKVALVAHPDDSANEVSVDNKEVVLFIGPEGGLIDYEVEMLESIGFKRFSFGKRTLRVEVAVPVGIAKLF